MALKSYRELESWQRAIDLVEGVYAATRTWPESERFGLTSQAQRAAVSVPANIAEGYGRSHRKEYVHHLSIARGSRMELETHIVVAHRLGYIEKESATDLWQLAQRVGQMLNVQMSRLKRAKSSPGPRAPDPGARS